MGAGSKTRTGRRCARSVATLATAVLALVAGLGLAPVPVGVPGGPAPAYADESRLRGSLSTGEVSRRTVLVPVPDGVVLRRLVGKVRVGATAPGTPVPSGLGELQVLVGDRVAETVPARPRTTLRTVVRRSDLDRDGRLPVTLQWVGGCAPPGLVATLADLRLLHGGAEETPRTERAFLGEAVSRVDVVVPRSAPDDVLEAGLRVVALLAERYDDVPVSLATADSVLPRVGAGQRVVRLEPGAVTSRGIEQRFGLWTLVLRGPGPDLVDVVRRGLGAPDRGSSAATAPAERRTLADLGVPDVSLGGWGTSTVEVPLPRDLLGGPGAGLDVRLSGSRTALPAGTTARVDVRLDGTLLDSVDLVTTDDSALDLAVTVPEDRLRPGSALEVSLVAAPQGGCGATAATLPVSLDLDAARSSVTPERAEGSEASDVPRAGLDRLPAALGGALPVALRAEGRTRAEAAGAAGRLVAALQRLAGLPLQVELVAADDLLADNRPGLLVGATAQDTLAVQAPARLERGAGVGVLPQDEPFAALQAVRHRDRDLLLLGSWGPEAADAEPLVGELVDLVVARGATAWDDGALVLPASGTPVVLDPAPPSDPLSSPERENTYAPYLVAAAGLLGLLLLGQVGQLVGRERRRRAAARAPLT